MQQNCTRPYRTERLDDNCFTSHVTSVLSAEVGLLLMFVGIDHKERKIDRLCKYLWFFLQSGVFTSCKVNFPCQIHCWRSSSSSRRWQ
jgi:hypothetical protein